MPDSITSALSFFGKVADDLSREPVPSTSYRVDLELPAVKALQRSDDYFLFQNLKPSSVDYQFQLESPIYQARRFHKKLSGPAPVELQFDGEDDLVVAIRALNAPNQVSFDPIEYLPRIRKGALAFGEGGFASSLKEDLGGSEVTSASLQSLAGLASGSLVRIVRSSNLIAKPGPLYPFPPGTTLLAVRTIQDAPGDQALSGVRAQLKKVNALTPATSTVGAVQLRHVTLGSPPAQRLILGQDRDLESLSDDRGNLIFYFLGQLPVTSLEIEFSHSHHVTKTSTLPVIAGQRASVTLKLAPN